MKQFLKFLTKLKGFWKIYSCYGYDGETVEFIIENYTEVLENRTLTMSKPTYYAEDVIKKIDEYYKCNPVKVNGNKISVNLDNCRKEYSLGQIETIVRAYEDIQNCKEHAGERLHSEEHLKIVQLRQQIECLEENSTKKDELIEIMKKNTEETKKKISILNDRHQSDYIRITELHTALDVVIRKYEKIKEIHGL